MTKWFCLGMMVPGCLFPANTRMGFTWFTGEAAGEGVQEKERRERTRGGRGRKRDWSLVLRGKSAFTESKPAIRPPT